MYGRPCCFFLRHPYIEIQQESLIVEDTVNDILFKMNVLSVFLLVACSLSGMKGQHLIKPTEQEGKSL